ncbi:MAG TPA: sensor histidine kinase, partial [Anaerolineaceae bacterium]|nr:sensor histidine kinase [Anaerolineaceae bacterium]
LLCAPLIWEGEYLGGLVVRADSAVRQFTDADIPTLEIFTPLIAALLARCSALAFQPDNAAQVRQEVEAEIRELREVRKRMAKDADELVNVLADTVAIQEEERSRIAHDLHDGSNQLVIGAIYEIQAAQTRIAREKLLEANESLETAKKLMRRIEAENRKIIQDLRPPMLNNQGLEVTLKWYLNNLCKRHGLEGSLVTEGSSKRFSAEVETAVFRIVQEALNNSLKHAQAQKLQIRLDYQPGFLVLSVQDDGCGFDLSEPFDPRHYGIIGMRERALSVGAQLEIRSAPGVGTRLVLHVPVLATPKDPVGQLEQRHSVQVAYTTARKGNWE